MECAVALHLDLLSAIHMIFLRIVQHGNMHVPSQFRICLIWRLSMEDLRVYLCATVIVRTATRLTSTTVMATLGGATEEATEGAT